MDNPGAIDWSGIHKLVFVDQPGCWQTCGGACCVNESAYLSFSFLQPGTAGMVFMEEEFEFLKTNQLLQKGFLETSRRWSYRIDDALSLDFYVAKCSLRGLCSLPSHRPLCCKVYPFLPRLELETSEVTGFVNTTVFDQFWEHIDAPHPCTLVREHAETVKRQMEPALLQVMRYPYFLIHIKAVELFLDSVWEGIGKLRRENPGLSSHELSQRWEVLYLKGLAFDSPKLKREIRLAYDVLRKRFPGFKLKGDTS